MCDLVIELLPTHAALPSSTVLSLTGCCLVSQGAIKRTTVSPRKQVWQYELGS